MHYYNQFLTQSRLNSKYLKSVYSLQSMYETNESFNEHPIRGVTDECDQTVVFHKRSSRYFGLRRISASLILDTSGSLLQCALRFQWLHEASSDWAKWKNIGNGVSCNLCTKQVHGYTCLVSPCVSPSRNFIYSTAHQESHHHQPLLLFLLRL